MTLFEVQDLIKHGEQCFQKCLTVVVFQWNHTRSLQTLWNRFCFVFSLAFVQNCCCIARQLCDLLPKCPSSSRISNCFNNNHGKMCKRRDLVASLSGLVKKLPISLYQIPIFIHWQHIHMDIIILNIPPLKVTADPPKINLHVWSMNLDKGGGGRHVALINS